MVKIRMKSRPPTKLEIELAKASNKKVRMIRFYAVRMLLEVELGRTLTQPEAKRLGYHVYSSFPKGSVQKGE